MIGVWAATPHPPRQLLGRLGYDSARLAGIRHSSAKHPGGLNLVVFPDRLSVAAGIFRQSGRATATPNRCGDAAHDRRRRWARAGNRETLTGLKPARAQVTIKQTNQYSGGQSLAARSHGPEAP